MVKMKDKKEKKAFPKKKYTDAMAVRATLMWSRRHTDTDVATELGVDLITVIRWKREQPLFGLGYELAAGPGTDATREKFADFAYNRLPAKLKAVWDELDAWHDHDSAYEKIEAIFKKEGKHVRQSLFIHGLIQFNFNIGEACARVNISRRTIEDWRKNDKGFQELMDEMKELKKDFFEGALTDLVAARHPLLVMFANKTYNKDRGYGETVKVEHSGEIAHKHYVVTIDQLNLPIEDRTKLLTAVREQKALEIKANQSAIDIKTSAVPAV